MQASSYDKIIWDHTWTFTVPDRSSAECIAYASIAIFCKQSNTHVQLYSCTCTASDCMSCSFNCKHSFSLFTLCSGTWGALNENLRELLHTNIPLISGNYGLRSSDACSWELLVWSGMIWERFGVILECRITVCYKTFGQICKRVLVCRALHVLRFVHHYFWGHNSH